MAVRIEPKCEIKLIRFKVLGWPITDNTMPPTNPIIRSPIPTKIPLVIFFSLGMKVAIKPPINELPISTNVSNKTPFRPVG